MGDSGQRPASFAEPGKETGSFGGLLADPVGSELGWVALVGFASQPMQKPPGGIGAQLLLVFWMGRLNQLLECYLEPSEMAIPS